MEVLDSIPVNLELEDVLKKVQIRNKNEDVEKDIQALLEITRNVARPKAVYKMSSLENRDGDSLEIDGTRFTSHILRINLAKVEKVFPYVVTCGRELDVVAFSSDEMMKFYFMDQIKEITLRLALNHLHDYLRENHVC